RTIRSGLRMRIVRSAAVEADGGRALAMGHKARPVGGRRRAPNGQPLWRAPPAGTSLNPLAAPHDRNGASMTLDTTVAFATFTRLASDFYGYEDVLSERERQVLADLRDYLEREVRPIVDDYWARAEFPTQVMKPLAELELFAMPWAETRPFENSAV